MRILERTTEDWEVESFEPLRSAFEAPFTRDIIDLHAEPYVRDVVTRLTSEVTGFSSTIPSGRCGYVVMMLRSVVKQPAEWLNIQVGDARVSNEVSEGDLYMYFSDIFMSHLANLRMSATRLMLHEMGMRPPTETLWEMLTG